MKATLCLLLITLCIPLAFGQSNKAPLPNDNFTTRATCRIETPNGVYVYFEDGQNGLYEGKTGKQLGLAYAPKCGFALPKYDDQAIANEVALALNGPATQANCAKLTAPTTAVFTAPIIAPSKAQVTLSAEKKSN